jgi:hypothetical protein
MEILAGIFCEHLKKRENLENLQVDGRITLKWLVKKKIRTTEGLL